MHEDFATHGEKRRAAPLNATGSQASELFSRFGGAQRLDHPHFLQSCASARQARPTTTRQGRPINAVRSLHERLLTVARRQRQRAQRGGRRFFTRCSTD